MISVRSRCLVTLVRTQALMPANRRQIRPCKFGAHFEPCHVPHTYVTPSYTPPLYQKLLQLLWRALCLPIKFTSKILCACRTQPGGSTLFFHLYDQASPSYVVKTCWRVFVDSRMAYPTWPMRSISQLFSGILMHFWFVRTSDYISTSGSHHHW